MKFIQTFCFEKSINPLKQPFGCAAPEYHLMGWALSCLQLQRLYGHVDLYCNDKAASLLKDQLGLPYTNVYESHDDLNIVNENLWALHKIFTYSLQNEPFLHLDGDVFLFKELPLSLLGSELIAQNMEEATPDVYSNTQKGLMKHFSYFPDCVNSEFINTIPIKAVNAGILGGRNTIFMKEYAEMAFRYVNRNAQHLSLINVYGFNVFFEQHLFYCLAKEKALPIGFLIKEIIKDDKYQHLGDFHETPCKNNYLHLIGEYKRDEYTCRQMAAKLRELYPEYYYRIIALCKTESAPLTVSFYTNKRFATTSDYIQFNKNSKERYSNSLQTEIPEITGNTSNSTLQSSEIATVALLKKYLNQMTGLSSITKNEADKDLIKFSKNIRDVLLRNKRIPFDYIYGRDLESVNWFCEIFGNDSDVPNKMIMKCNGIAIIKSVFDWGGLLNKIKRIGIEYYEALELEPGEFYNLVIPEIFADGFSIQDLDDMERNMLEHLSEPLLIKELFTTMHIYVEDDIIKKHLKEYEDLIIVMLKQLVLKKAIKPFKKRKAIN
jgi:hypothetical protein